MNFLSHFYFTQHSKDPYYTLGSILPDLLRNHGGIWRISPEKQREKFHNDPGLHALLKGWELHVQVDKIFHSSTIFISHTAALRKLLAPVFTRLPIRPFFLAHVGYELILDSLLIQENIVNTADFYDDLAACDPAIIQEFLTRAGVPDAASFLPFLESFIRSKYLDSYASSRKVVYALDRIGGRVWHAKFNEQEIAQCVKVLDDFKISLSPSFRDVFHEIERRTD